MQLVLDTHGLVVKVRNRRFHIIMRRDPKAAEGSNLNSALSARNSFLALL